MGRNSKSRRDKKRAREKTRRRRQRAIAQSMNSRLPSREWVQKKLRDHEKKLAEHDERFGKVRPQIATDFHGHKVVAVGSKLHFGSKWKTFPDFLADYVKTVLTPEWGNIEIQKPLNERHTILQWYDTLCHWQREHGDGSGEIFEGVPSGPVVAYYQIAYDLYVLGHHSSLQTEFVNRLKISDQFQGVRYELTIASTFIRAGFELEFLSENHDKKRPEFIATHKISGEKIYVEAKSRHRPGVLGFDSKTAGDDSLNRAGIRRLLHQALLKHVDGPYIICIDLNLPPISGSPFDTPIFKEVANTIATKERAVPNGGKFLASMILITNFPHHYGEEGKPDPSKTWILRNCHKINITIHDGEMV